MTPAAAPIERVSRGRAPTASGDADASAGVPIGRAAASAGVSTRTLRYYEELGLLAPSSRSGGGARRYSEADLARVGRIRDLQELLGRDLDDIKSVLDAEDRLGQLREEWADSPIQRRAEILAEATEINGQLRAQVRARQDALVAFASELETKARTYRELAAEMKTGAIA